MNMIADILMGAGAIGAGFYCYILSRRLTAFKNAEGGVGQAVATLSAQVSDLGETVADARLAARESENTLRELTSDAEKVAQRLELMVASMHDIPEPSDGASEKAENARPDEPVFSTRVGRAVEL